MAVPKGKKDTPAEPDGKRRDVGKQSDFYDRREKDQAWDLYEEHRPYGRGGFMGRGPRSWGRGTLGQTETGTRPETEPDIGED